MVEAEIYRALGDPIRLEIVKRLSTKSKCTIGELSENLGVTRQGARKQLQVLLDANVALIQRRGRETDVVLNAKTLHAASRFIFQLEREWDKCLEALKNFVEGPDSS